MGALTYLEIKARAAAKRIFRPAKGVVAPEAVVDSLVGILETQLQQVPGCGLFVAPDKVLILAGKADRGKFTQELLATVTAGLLSHIRNREYLLARELSVAVEESPAVKDGVLEFMVSRTQARLALALIVLDLQTQKNYRLAPGQVLQIGRAGGNDVLAEDEHVSGRHAALEFSTGYEIFLSDAGSSNGTYCNGAKISGRTVLKSGDRFQLTERHPVIFEVKIVAS